MERSFPLITVRKKSTECPWINNRIMKVIRRRKRVYRREGQLAKWRRLKKVTEDLVRDRRHTYLNSQKECLLVEDATRIFFRNVKAFKTKDHPKAFDPMSLFPGRSESEVAFGLASFFNRISAEFNPLEPRDIQRTHERRLPVLLPIKWRVGLGHSGNLN